MWTSFQELQFTLVTCPSLTVTPWYILYIPREKTQELGFQPTSCREPAFCFCYQCAVSWSNLSGSFPASPLLWGWRIVFLWFGCCSHKKVICEECKRNQSWESLLEPGRLSARNPHVWKLDVREGLGLIPSTPEREGWAKAQTHSAGIAHASWSFPEEAVEYLVSLTAEDSPLFLDTMNSCQDLGGGMCVDTV